MRQARQFVSCGIRPRSCVRNDYAFPPKSKYEEETMSPKNADTLTIDPKLDLVLDRVVPAPRAKIWRGWSEPALLKQWFAPLPWTVTDAEIDLRPGGLFRFVMQSPEGQSFPNTGL